MSGTLATVRWPRSFPLVVLDFEARVLKRYIGRRKVEEWTIERQPTAAEVEGVRAAKHPVRAIPGDAA